MSLAPYCYRPATPPEVTAVDQLNRSAHSRNASSSSCYSNNTSPDAAITHLITPNRSPVLRQHGPTLLPKIRTQDSMVDPSAGGAKKTHRRVLSTHNPPAVLSYSTSRPQVQRSVTEPLEVANPMSPISNSSHYGPRAASDVTKPVKLTVPPHSRRSSASHSRGGSTSSIDETMLSRYGYPTYRQLPVYVSQAPPTGIPSPTLFAPVEFQQYQQQPPINVIEATPYPPQDDFDFTMDLSAGFDSRPASLTPPPSISQQNTSPTNLLHYLTAPTQPINLVRHLTLPTGRGACSHFWWDVRNIRPWADFSLATISSVPGLMSLLTLPLDSATFPPAAAQPLTTLTPSSESDLASTISKLYFPKINSAIALSTGANNSLQLFLAPAPSKPSSGTSHPTFLATYPTSPHRTLTGLPRGSLVGLCLSFDRWNTGMRHSGGPARKVDYLNGLSHLHKAMRDHSCRYGFIITEIELVCVRAGCDNQGRPYFGKLDIAEAIPTKLAVRDSDVDTETPLTVSLALHFLLMLSKSHPLPNQSPGFMDVGGPGALTRQRIWNGSDVAESERGKEGRDKWIPEPQVGEKRDAKRVRGWIWPSDPWHRREGGGGRRAKVGA